MLIVSKFHCLPDAFNGVTLDFKKCIAVLVEEGYGVQILIVASHTHHDLLDLNVFWNHELFAYLHSIAKLNGCCSVVERETHCRYSVDASPFDFGNSDVSEKRFLLKLLQVSRFE